MSEFKVGDRFKVAEGFGQTFAPAGTQGEITRAFYLYNDDAYDVQYDNGRTEHSRRGFALEKLEPFAVGDRVRSVACGGATVTAVRRCEVKVAWDSNPDRPASEAVWIPGIGFTKLPVKKVVNTLGTWLDAGFTTDGAKVFTRGIANAFNHAASGFAGPATLPPLEVGDVVAYDDRNRIESGTVVEENIPAFYALKAHGKGWLVFGESKPAKARHLDWPVTIVALNGG